MTHCRLYLSDMSNLKINDGIYNKNKVTLHTATCMYIYVQSVMLCTHNNNINSKIVRKVLTKEVLHLLLKVHSSVMVYVYTHIQILSEPSDIFRKLTRWCVQQPLVTISRVHPLIEILGAVHSFRNVVHVI